MYLMSLLNGSRGTTSSLWACLSPVDTLSWEHKWNDQVRMPFPSARELLCGFGQASSFRSLSLSFFFQIWTLNELLSSRSHCHSQFYPKCYTNERKTSMEEDRRGRGDVWWRRKDRKTEGRKEGKKEAEEEQKKEAIRPRNESEQEARPGLHSVVTALTRQCLCFSQIKLLPNLSYDLRFCCRAK